MGADGKTFQEHGPVIIATGGFGADFTPDSLLSRHRPDLSHLPTTNGDHCTGDGLKMSMGVGAECVDLEWLQRRSVALGVCCWTSMETVSVTSSGAAIMLQA